MNLTYGNLRIVPCANRRVTFAEAVRRAALEFQPNAIAIQLPSTLEPWVVSGVSQLPQITVVSWPVDGESGSLAWLPIDPCDGMIEAIRLGCENDLPVEFIDLDLPGQREPYQYLPDDLIIDFTSLEQWLDVVLPFAGNDPGDPLAAAREYAMARRLRQMLDAGQRVLFVSNVAWCAGVARRVVADILPEQPLPAGAIERREGVQLSHVHPRSLVEVLGEMPFLTFRYEVQRDEEPILLLNSFGKLAVIHEILRDAENHYMERYHEQISMTQKRGLVQYVRNLALLAGRLRPDTYELVVAARGMVDGDFGHEVFEVARQYPPQSAGSDYLPTFHSRNGRCWIKGDDRKFLQRPYWEPPATETVHLHFKRRPPREMREIWKEQWDRNPLANGICSWPPEDEVQENFMDFIRKRALQVITEDRSRVEEFSTSMQDGLDIRETMRNWHTQKIFVQSTPQPQGKVGSVVIVFGDEPIQNEAGWRQTLHAEHNNESDIAFFASPLGNDVVGPRICRTEFNGLLSVFPSRFIPNIWQLDLGLDIEWASDVLLAGGLFFGAYKYVAYVSERPPRPLMTQLATALKKQIIYLPLTMFSRRHLKKIRRFHILDGHDVRLWARDYIFED